MKSILRQLFNYISPSFRFKKNSYSQYGEDILVKSILQEYFGIDRPSYLDIGAHHPFHLSNSALLYRFGCRGINIEANPDLIKAFHKYRPMDINLNIGIGTSESEVLPFYIMEQPELNTFVKQQATDLASKGYPIKRVEQIKCHSLSFIIDHYCKGVFPDFLSLDVEGLDEHILSGYDFKETRPKLICVENLQHNEDKGFYKNNKLRSILENNNYFLIGDTVLNDIYADAHLLKFSN